LRIVEKGLVDVDLVLSDIVMPDLDGAEFASRLAQIAPELPVLFMSGYTDSALKRYNLESKRASLITKPFSRSALIEQIERVISSSKVV